MASYFDSLSQQQRDNIAFMIKRMNHGGITNPYAQAGILAVASKESAFIPKSETSYRNTPNDRIRAVFGARLGGYDDAHLSKLKADDVAFYDAVYGPQTSLGYSLGNTSPGDGYKYRGRGLNGITFKNLYKKYGDKIGVDLVNHPERLNEIEVAADALVEYFKEQFAKAPKNILAEYHTTGVNDFTNTADSVGAFYHANAGWGKSVATIKADPTGGRKRATDRVDGFLNIVNSVNQQVLNEVKKNPS